MYTPTAAALITAIMCGTELWRALWELYSMMSPGLHVVKWYLLAPLPAYAALGIYMAITWAVGRLELERLASPSGGPARALALLPLSYLAALTVNAFYALGEEAGWRGFLYNTLVPPLGFWRASLVIGVLWGLWHASAIAMLGFNYPRGPRGGSSHPRH